MSKRATIYFNNGEANGRRTTFNGGVEVVRNGEETDLYIRGPKGGLRHVVCMPWHEAVHLGEELLRLHEDKNPETEGECSPAASGAST
jgi:hypothetical protein